MKASIQSSRQSYDKGYKQGYKNGVENAVKNMIATMVLVLGDKFGFIESKIVQAIKYFNKYFDEINEGRITLHDVKEISKENNINVIIDEHYKPTEPAYKWHKLAEEKPPKGIEVITYGNGKYGKSGALWNEKTAKRKDYQITYWTYYPKKPIEERA